MACYCPSEIMTGRVAPMEGTNYVGRRDLRLLPLPLSPTSVAWAIVWGVMALFVQTMHIFTNSNHIATCIGIAS